MVWVRRVLMFVGGAWICSWIAYGATILVGRFYVVRDRGAEA